MYQDYTDELVLKRHARMNLLEMANVHVFIYFYSQLYVVFEVFCSGYDDIYMCEVSALDRNSCPSTGRVLNLCPAPVPDL